MNLIAACICHSNCYIQYILSSSYNRSKILMLTGVRIVGKFSLLINIFDRPVRWTKEEWSLLTYFTLVDRWCCNLVFACSTLLSASSFCMFLELTDFFSFACNQSYVVCSKLLLIRIKITFCWADCQVDRSVKYAIFMGVRNSANIYAVKIVSEVILCSSVVKTSYPVITPLIQEVPPVGALLIQANINACGWLDLFLSALQSLSLSKCA